MSHKGLNIGSENDMRLVLGIGFNPVSSPKGHGLDWLEGRRSGDVDDEGV
jgi:hypothetical protein